MKRQSDPNLSRRPIRRNRGIHARRENTQMFSMRVPREWLPKLEAAIRSADVDFSKFIRAAIREKLQREGVKI